MRTEMILPPIWEPLTASTDAMASSGLENRTVPKPLRRFEGLVARLWTHATSGAPGVLGVIT